MEQDESGTVNDTTLLQRYGAEQLQQIHRIKQKAKLCGTRITTAESITSGGIFHRLSLISGGSDSLVSGGTIAYSDRSKAINLNVSRTALDQFTAVSPEVAKRMALRSLQNSEGATLAVATTGYAGQPRGKTPESKGWPWPRSATPGELYVAIAFQPEPNEHPAVFCQRYQLTGYDRTKDIDKAIELAFNALEETIDRHIKTNHPEALEKYPDLFLEREATFYCKPSHPTQGAQR